MIEFEDYCIQKIGITDAIEIHHLMIANAKRFQRYFPETLKQNLTIKLAQLFASKKVKEFNNKEEFLFVIKNKPIKKIIGLIYIKELDWNEKQGEFAYCLDKSYESKGLMSRVVKELSNYAFTNLRFEVLQIIIHKSNIGSVKVAEKNNFIWQKVLLNEHAPPNEAPLDMELYELYNPNS